MNGYSLVRFVDKIELNPEEHYGMYNSENNTIVCFCCGGVLEAEDYDILERDIPWGYLDDLCKEYLGSEF